MGCMAVWPYQSVRQGVRDVWAEKAVSQILISIPRWPWLLLSTICSLSYFLKYIAMLRNVIETCSSPWWRDQNLRNGFFGPYIPHALSHALVWPYSHTAHTAHTPYSSHTSHTAIQPIHHPSGISTACLGSWCTRRHTRAPRAATRGGWRRLCAMASDETSKRNAERAAVVHLVEHEVRRPAAACEVADARRGHCAGRRSVTRPGARRAHAR